MDRNELKKSKRVLDLEILNLKTQIENNEKKLISLKNIATLLNNELTNLKQVARFEIKCQNDINKFPKTKELIQFIEKLNLNLKEKNYNSSSK